MSRRIRIDTDAACGASPKTDPDDCLAIVLLAKSDGLEIAGISTMHGNATLDITDQTTRSLVDMLTQKGRSSVTVSHGSPAPIPSGGPRPLVPANVAFQQALAEGQLTILELGPLTNVAAALEGRSDLQRNVTRLVAVMGHRPGHIFHPSEGSGGGMLLGHGPVFRDLNFTKDVKAAAAVFAMQVPVTFVPYAAAHHVMLDSSDLNRMAGSSEGQWVAARAFGWLKFWQKDIGLRSLNPSNLIGAAYVIKTSLFNCAYVHVWIAPDHQLWSDWFYSPDALLVGRNDVSQTDTVRQARVIYCGGVDPHLKEWLVSQLSKANQ